jgi:hypothetical protein
MSEILDAASNGWYAAETHMTDRIQDALDALYSGDSDFEAFVARMQHLADNGLDDLL